MITGCGAGNAMWEGEMIYWFIVCAAALVYGALVIMKGDNG